MRISHIRLSDKDSRVAHDTLRFGVSSTLAERAYLDNKVALTEYRLQSGNDCNKLNTVLVTG